MAGVKYMKHLKQLSLLLPVALAGVWIVGCSSTPKQVDHGPVKAHTFSFVNGGVTPAAAAADPRASVHLVIQDALTQNLTAKGLAKVTTGADVTVAYLLIVGNNTTTEAITTYFGMGRDASGLSEKAHAAYTENKNPNYFEAGTLLVDIIDTKTFKVLHRNYVVRPVLRNPSVAARAANIQMAVDKVMSDLRVAQ